MSRRSSKTTSSITGQRGLQTLAALAWSGVCLAVYNLLLTLAPANLHSRRGY
jgi:hypothetical protein